MTTDQLIGIVGIVATVLVGGKIVYNYKVKKKNSGIRQENGNNQISLQKSKQNTIIIGEGNSKNEEEDNPK